MNNRHLETVHGFNAYPTGVTLTPVSGPVPGNSGNINHICPSEPIHFVNAGTISAIVPPDCWRMGDLTYGRSMELTLIAQGAVNFVATNTEGGLAQTVGISTGTVIRLIYMWDSTLSANRWYVSGNPYLSTATTLPGVVGDGTTDNYAIINAAIQAAGWTGIKDIYLGFDANGLGKYYISQPLVFSHIDYGGSGNDAGRPGVQRFIMAPGTELIYNGTGAAVTITGYRATALLDEDNQANFRLAVRKSSMAWDTTDSTSVGVKIVDCNSCKFWIESTVGYNTGLLLTNSSNDCTDNDIWLGRLSQHKTYVQLLSSGGKGVNQNRFHGGVLAAVGSSLSNVSITGTAGQFSCTAPNTTLYSGQPITVSGTNTGSGNINSPTYTNPTTYTVSITNGSTTFTLVNTSDGSALTTTAGTTTGWTFTPLAIKGTRFLWLSSGSCNTNVFYGTDVEGNLVEYALDCAGSANSFENVRFEAINQINVTGNSNRFTGGYWSNGRLDIVSDTGINNMYSTGFTERKDVGGSYWPSMEWFDNTLRVTGNVTTSGNTVTWVDGNKFPVGGLGLYQGMITINGKPYEINTNVTPSDTSLALTTAVPTNASKVPYSYDQRVAAYWPMSKRLSIGGAGFTNWSSNFPDQLQVCQPNSGGKASISAGVMQGTRQPLISVGIDDSGTDVIGRVLVGTLSGASKLILETGSSGNTLTVSSTGNVGIGNTSPSGKLHVYGGPLNVEQTGTDYGMVIGELPSRRRFQYDPTNSWFTGLDSTNTLSSLYMKNVYATNNIGIGTTSPSTPLHIVSSSFGDVTMEGAGSRLNIIRNNAGANTGIAFKDGAATRWSIDFIDSTRDSSEGLGITKAGLGGPLSNAILYLSYATGYVGVGNTSPQQKLHVSGNIRIDGVAQILGAAPTASAIGASGDVAGMVAFDSGYVYYCTAPYDGSTHIWKRAALSSY